MKFLQATIQVRDMESSLKFYQEFLGLRLRDRLGGSDREIAFLQGENGETAIELIHVPQAKKFQGQGISIGFGVDDLSAFYKKAQEADLNPGKIIAPNDSIKFFFIKDPDGVAVQICQITA
ncbi:MAG: VOC family protein [Bacillota bacterium]|nr:VOC family protein [Bacillota bacterium]